MEPASFYKYDPINSHTELNPERLLVDQPDWCIGPITGLVWRVRNNGDRPPSIIDFNYLLPNGNRLPDYPNLLNTSQRIVRLMRDGPNSTLHTGDTLAQFAKALMWLVSYMVLGNIFRFEDFTADDAKDFALRARFGVDNLMDMEDRLDEAWAILARNAGFAQTDTVDERISKAKQFVPVKGGLNSRLMIDRFEFLRQLGFESKTNGSQLVRAMLRRFELECQSAGDAIVPVEDVEDELVTSEYLRRLLMPLVEIHAHQRFLKDAIREHPFTGRSASELANRLGREAGRTKLPSITQAATFIEGCWRWVHHYAPKLLAEACIEFSGCETDKSGAGINTEVGETTGPASPFPLAPDGTTTEESSTPYDAEAYVKKPSLQKALSYLSVACAVIIAVFSARRASEIRGLRAGCISFDEGGRAWMRIFIHKSLQQEVLLPVPRAVVAAVSVLEALSRDARRVSGTEFLFQRMANGQVVGVSKANMLPTFGFHAILGEFSNFVDTPLDEEGRKWVFRPHQFRKLFAVLYVWAFGGRLSTLSWFLLHNDLEMTWRYASDDTLGQYIAMANRQKTASILTQAALGQAEFKGPAAKHFNELAARLYDEYAQTVQVISESRLQERILRHVESAQIDITGFPFGYCGHSRNAEEQSACGAAASSTPQDLWERGSLERCGRCCFAFDTIEFRPFVSSMMRRHEKVVGDEDAPPIMRQASQVVLDACVKKLKHWGEKNG